MKIVILCSNSTSSAIVCNALSKQFEIDKIIVEKSVSKKLLFKRRIKRLGLFTAMGQALFSLLIAPILRKVAVTRRKEILRENGLEDSPCYQTESNTLFVDSVNAQKCKDYLMEAKPDIVVVNGTRIISREILECTDAVFINMHAGITPKYRGSHGAYWALCNGDAAYAGVTVHLVDPGIDTGNIIYQATITITEKDNFATYPLLQTAAGLPLEIQAIRDIMSHSLQTHTNDMPSKLYYNPTAFQYIRNRIKLKVK